MAFSLLLGRTNYLRQSITRIVFSKHLKLPNDYQRTSIQVVNDWKQCTCRSSINYGVGRQDRFLRIQSKWMARDGIPEGYEMVYKTPMNVYLAAASFFTTTLFVVTVVMIATYGFDPETLNQPLVSNSDMVIADSAFEAIAFFSLFTVVFIAVRILTMRFALRMYNKDKDYIAVFQGYFPGIKNKLNFREATVEPLPPARYIGWEEAKFRVNNKNIYLLDDYFRTQHDYRRIQVGFKDHDEDDEEEE